MDRGPWQAIVHRATKSRTKLKWLNITLKSLWLSCWELHGVVTSFGKKKHLKKHKWKRAKKLHFVYTFWVLIIWSGSMFNINVFVIILFFYWSTFGLQCFRWITLLQSDSVIHTCSYIFCVYVYIYMYSYMYVVFLRLFSIIDYYKILNIV